jgi:hypothetical protein
MMNIKIRLYGVMLANIALSKKTIPMAPEICINNKKKIDQKKRFFSKRRIC